MTDEDLSELAECLADAIAVAGIRIRPFNARSPVPYGPGVTTCPLGAMVGERYPNPGMVAQWLGIPSEIAYGIARGFDGDGPVSIAGAVDLRAFALGRLFREELAP